MPVDPKPPQPTREEYNAQQRKNEKVSQPDQRRQSEQRSRDRGDGAYKDWRKE